MGFADVKHQEWAVRRLLQARSNRRLAHGLIFHGPEGVGKKLAALALGQLLLCEKGQGSKAILEDACGACASCQLAAAGTHPDLHLVHKGLIKYTPEGKNRQALSLSIEVIRQFLIEPANRAPVRGRAVVFIVEDAHLMQLAAQNALLKTLEEPPGESALILITSQSDRLLETIRSRCQLVSFAALPKDFLEQRLEQAGIPAAEAHFWAGFAEGRLGPALQLAQLELYPTVTQLAERLAVLDGPAALETAGWLMDIVKQLAERLEKDQPELTKSAATRLANGMILDLIDHLFHLEMLAATGWLGPHQELAGRIGKLAQRTGLIGLADGIRATQRTKTALAANANPALLMESLVIQYAGRPVAPTAG